MNYNNKIIRGLIICIIVLSIILIINYNYMQNDLIDSFILSFISGALVSLFMTYIQYKKEKEDAIINLVNKLTRYHVFLDNLESILTLNTEDDFEIAKDIFENYFTRNDDYRNDQLNLISHSLDSLFIQTLQKLLSVCSTGTLFLPFFIKFSKKNIQEIKKICKQQKEQINVSIELILMKTKFDYRWNFKHDDSDNY